jgi:cell division protein FtsQ
MAASRKPSAQRARQRSTQRAALWAGRAWRPWLSGALLLAAVLAGAAYGHRFLTQPDLLPLRVVQVKGELRHLDRADIERTVAGAIDGGFFSCDMRKLRRAVLAMPWVADVSIRRVWPDTLQMTVSEQQPLARWGDGALVNTAAEVFAPPTASSYAELVRLHGPEGSAARVVAFYRALLPAAERRGLRVRALEQDPRRHWWVHFDGDLTLSLGRERVQQRLAQFFRIYPGLAGQPARRPARVDMRYAHGFAVRWHDTTGTDAPEPTPQPQEPAREQA